jgi:hypothetical protein
VVGGQQQGGIVRRGAEGGTLRAEEGTVRAEGGTVRAEGGTVRAEWLQEEGMKVSLHDTM